MTVQRTTDLADRLAAMADEIALARSDKDPAVILIRQGAALLREAADALEAAEVVVDLWGPVERGQSEFTDALSSLRETLDRS